MNHRHIHRLGRRKLLRALGLGAAASPLIPLLNASGQELTRPKRLVLIFEPDGAPALNYNSTVDFRPQGSPTDFALHPIHAPLEPFKSKLVVPWGLKLTAGGAGEAHAFGMAGLWTGSTLHGPGAGADFDGGNGNRTGWGAGPLSIRSSRTLSAQTLPISAPETIPCRRPPTEPSSSGCACQNATSLNRMIYAGDNSPIHPEMNPRAAFDRLFAGVSTEEPPPSTGEDPSKLRKQAIIDVVKGDLASLRNRIGSEEYAKVDAHLEGLLALERRLNVPTTPPPASCVVRTRLREMRAFPTRSADVRHRRGGARLRRDARRQRPAEATRSATSPTPGSGTRATITTCLTMGRTAGKSCRRSIPGTRSSSPISPASSTR